MLLKETSQTVALFKFTHGNFEVKCSAVQQVLGVEIVHTFNVWKGRLVVSTCLGILTTKH